MTPRPDTDAPLSENDRALIAALARDFRQSLERYFAKRCKEKSEIDDLVQEVFLRLAKRASLSDIEKAQGYVFQVASSVLNDWIRKKKVRLSELHDEFIESKIDEAKSTDLSPERVLLGKDGLAEATAILSELPERTRAVFILRRLEGLRYKDIAARLGVSVSAAERHMKRASLHLMKRLREK